MIGLKLSLQIDSRPQISIFTFWQFTWNLKPENWWQVSTFVSNDSLELLRISLHMFTRCCHRLRFNRHWSTWNLIRSITSFNQPWTQLCDSPTWKKSFLISHDHVDEAEDPVALEWIRSSSNFFLSMLLSFLTGETLRDKIHLALRNVYWKQFRTKIFSRQTFKISLENFCFVSICKKMWKCRNEFSKIKMCNYSDLQLVSGGVCWKKKENFDGENEMKSFDENDEMTAINYKNHRLAPAAVLEPTTAKYLLDFIYFTRDDEQFRFYKKVSTTTVVSSCRCQAKPVNRNGNFCRQFLPKQHSIDLGQEFKNVQHNFFLDLNRNFILSGLWWLIDFRVLHMLLVNYPIVLIEPRAVHENLVRKISSKIISIQSTSMMKNDWWVYDQKCRRIIIVDIDSQFCSWNTKWYVNGLCKLKGERKRKKSQITIQDEDWKVLKFCFDLINDSNLFSCQEVASTAKNHQKLKSN